MEPLNPQLRQTILARTPEASPAEIDEYETLLAERFVRDPSEAEPPSEPKVAEAKASRLSQLYEKLIRPLER